MAEEGSQSFSQLLQLRKQDKVKESSSEDEMFQPASRRISRPLEKGYSPPRTPDTPSEAGGFSFDSIYQQQQYGSTFYNYRERLDSRASIVDDLLYEIYDRCHYQRDSVDSDTFTECSSTSDAFFGRSDCIQLDYEKRHSRQLHPAFLEQKGIEELQRMVTELHHRINHTSARLVRQLKRKDRHLARLQKNCDVVTAVLQAASLKRPIDMKMRFSLEPLPGDECFQQWTAAMKAVARLPMGIPPQFRKKVWLSLADQYIASIKVDWEKTKRFAFNERSNPDDNKLGLQIVKDLHRTGCSGFSGQDNEDDRAVLKRVLLGYARWNKQVGYCQGFNMLAALILDVMDRKEDDALKVMIFLIDHVLPESYFANNLRALSVDMAVFRELLSMHLPTLSHHLDKLQAAARDHNTGANYEPPLTNVFTMQWFLTIFATCLPKACALRVWDSVILEGSEVLLRTALAIWGKLQSRILSVHSADEFYMTMGIVTQDMLDSSLINSDQLIKTVYSMAHFPFPGLAELREKFTYNITPFTAAMATGQRPTKKGSMNIFSDEDEIDEDEVMDNITCFSGVFASQISPNRAKPLSEEHRSASAYDISKVSPGAYGANSESQPTMAPAAYMERMTMDIDMLKKQYSRLRQRQKQAHIIMTAASAKHMAKRKKPGEEKPAIVIPSVAPIESPVALNHLFLTRSTRGGKNRHVAKAPNISPYYMKSCLVGSQLNALTTRTDPVVPPERRNSVFDDHGGPPESHNRSRRASNHSIDSFMSEASNNTRGSVTGTVEITSDAETIGDGSDCASESSVKTDSCKLNKSNSLNSDSADNEENHEHLRENESRESESSEITSPAEDESKQDHSSEESKETNDPTEVNADDNSHIKDSDSVTNNDSDSLDSSKARDSLPGAEEDCVSNVEQEASVGVANTENNNDQVKIDNSCSQEDPQLNNNTLQSEKAEFESSESATVDSANSVESSPVHKPLTLSLPARNGQISRSQEMRGKNGSRDGQSLAVSPVTPVSPNLPYNFYRSHSSLSDSSSSDFSAPNSPVKSGRVFNPFPVRHVNKKKMQNSIRLGLYSADTASQVTTEPRGFQPQKPIKNIGRAQINACLHRQYMMEVKNGNTFK